MIEKKFDKNKSEKPRDDGVELENQFILRLPEEPAKALIEALQNGNLKDRMTIKMDNDLRYGEVTFDQWHLHSKVVDLPTVLECLKTIDNKSFYKTADICQMMICKEEPDALDSEKESPNKAKKKDPNKVDKKYLWPHGITPPCKNIRKRRFRKTLKKKNVEAPEIEKEVKHLLRIDNDAVKVEYEIINEELDKPALDQSSKEYNEGEEEFNDTLNDGEKTLNDSATQKNINVESDDDDVPSSSAAIGGVGEHDIFGEELSSSEDEERNVEMEYSSRLSADDTHTSDFSASVGGAGTIVADSSSNSKQQPTEFNRSMFGGSPKPNLVDMSSKFDGSSSNLAAPSGYYEEQKRNDYDDDFSNDIPQIETHQIRRKINELQGQINDLKMLKAQKSQEIAAIQNQTLKQRMSETVENLLSQIIEKEMQIKSFEKMLENN
ncbi:transcription initiation factor TFIID subunit 7 [Teleopsis dalmanni]|uniref:transcription initiation factor TFIID subunit 7 n=1 Tax=Teleopsis dalmanni TaxID=139649 RepID=UPI0018CD7F22|nr:transcription initiation factor TFIID subunit 7 [Teleopsis dalmanni]